MQVEPIVVNTIAAGISAMCLAILLTAPPAHLLSSFFCGFAGRLTRDLLLMSGVRSGWATLFAAVTVVLVGTAILRRREVSPVVIISGVLPLGATSSMFTAIVHLMRVANLEGEELSKASDALVADAGRVFTTSIAIAAGIGIGIVTMRIMHREQVWTN